MFVYMCVCFKTSDTPSTLSGENYVYLYFLNNLQLLQTCAIDLCSVSGLKAADVSGRVNVTKC